MPPFEIQQRASDAAFMLRQEYADRLTMRQNIDMEIIGMVAPDRLDWEWCGAAIATYLSVVQPRK
jgi:hypothetical protein